LYCALKDVKLFLWLFATSSTQSEPTISLHTVKMSRRCVTRYLLIHRYSLILITSFLEGFSLRGIKEEIEGRVIVIELLHTNV
jgi:hypothetical protein